MLCSQWQADAGTVAPISNLQGVPILDLEKKKEIVEFIRRTKSMVISALNAEGIPIMKAVTMLGNDGLNSLYFCTSPKSEFFIWYKNNPRTSIYLFDDDPNTPYPSANEKYCSLALIGKVEVVTDRGIKWRFLSDYSYYLSAYYKVDDEEYDAIRFVPQSGTYYQTGSDGSFSYDFEISPYHKRSVRFKTASLPNYFACYGRLSMLININERTSQGGILEGPVP